MKKTACFLIGILLCLSISAWATPITFSLYGTTYQGISAQAEFAYVPIDQANGQIDISILNNSIIQSSLTAFAFNAPDGVSTLSLLSGPDGWSAVLSPNGINTPMQYGSFDVAGVTGPNFNGGSPNYGINQGQTGDFTLSLIGTAMDQLSEQSFLGLFSDLGGKVGTPEYFAARFQDIGEWGGSDVAVPGTAPVPEPGTIVLLGVGFFGLAIYGKRRRNSSTDVAVA